MEIWLNITDGSGILLGRIDLTAYLLDDKTMTEQAKLSLVNDILDALPEEH